MASRRQFLRTVLASLVAPSVLPKAIGAPVTDFSDWIKATSAITGGSSIRRVSLQWTEGWLLPNFTPLEATRLAITHSFHHDDPATKGALSPMSDVHLLFPVSTDDMDRAYVDQRITPCTYTEPRYYCNGIYDACRASDPLAAVTCQVVAWDVLVEMRGVEQFQLICDTLRITLAQGEAFLAAWEQCDEESAEISRQRGQRDEPNAYHAGLVARRQFHPMTWDVLNRERTLREVKT